MVSAKLYFIHFWRHRFRDLSVYCSHLHREYCCGTSVRFFANGLALTSEDLTKFADFVVDANGINVVFVLWHRVPEIRTVMYQIR